MNLKRGLVGLLSSALAVGLPCDADSLREGHLFYDEENVTTVYDGDAGQYAYRAEVGEDSVIGEAGEEVNILGPSDSETALIDGNAEFVVHFDRDINYVSLHGELSDWIFVGVYSASPVYLAKAGPTSKFVLDGQYIIGDEPLISGGVQPRGNGFKDYLFDLHSGGRVFYFRFSDDYYGRRTNATFEIDSVKGENR